MVTWKSYPLKDGSKNKMTFLTDLTKLPTAPGVYIFARRWGAGFEALYVGKAGNIRGRIKNQLNNNLLMNHVLNARAGARVVYAGVFNPKPGQRVEVCLPLIEKALIRHFVSELHDIVNKQGKKLKQHTVISNGSFHRGTMAAKISVER
jgi:hypothetical protein